MKCPRDHVELVEVTLEKKVYRQCPSCRGLFVGVGGKLQGLNLPSMKPMYDHCVETGEPQIISPESGKPMQRYIYQGVNLDYCKSSNSIWMDGGELENLSKRAKRDTQTLKNLRSKNSSSSVFSSVDASDVGADSVLSFIGEAVVSLFDGL